jgi:hypothetical protein
MEGAYARGRTTRVIRTCGWWGPAIATTHQASYVTLDKRNGTLPSRNPRNLGRKNMGGETRRNFILAGSAQAVLALQSSVAFGQDKNSSDLSLPSTEALDRVIDRTEFSRANQLSAIFGRLFETKLDITLATTAEDARNTLFELARKAQETLEKDFPDGPIPRENLRTVLAGTILVQNIVFGGSTDLKTGIVSITSQEIRNLTQYYCSFYPYCK